jgi:hypothetical protein
MIGLPFEVVDRVVASGQEPGAAVAVVRDQFVQIDYPAGIPREPSLDNRYRGDDRLRGQAFCSPPLFGGDLFASFRATRDSP